MNQNNNPRSDSPLAGAQILVVDDQELIRDFFIAALKPRGVEVTAAVDGIEARDILASSNFDILISDVKMPRMDGMELLRHCLGTHPTLPVILLTAFASVENAVEAMRTGAFDYIAKPVTDIDTVEFVLKRALAHRRLLVENQQLRSELGGRSIFDRLVGPGPQMQRIFDIIATVAKTQATVLITGASGTGKELVARAIHMNSTRAKAPFVSVNCAALPEGLFESELFGHEKGSFTGAFKTTKGRFEAADGGTLLLDEISEMPLSLQAKLLRALQEREFERVGSTTPVKVDVRVIATSNVDLEKAVEEKRFRHDLFFRLNVIPIQLPRLSERRADIPVLAHHFLGRFNRLHAKKVDRISRAALNYLINAPWHGNVRELENSIERAVVMCRSDQIEVTDFFLSGETPPGELSDQPLLPAIPSFTSDTGSPVTLAEIEKQHILNTLKALDNHRQRTADALGISIRTLRNKLNEYKLDIGE